ncbi:MAG: hypothetical protein U1C56_00140, partial [Candidatus Curtissbacteria bacterium]|nr:hypothetical protein [Candidatus Curtissbacteria bacterium]
MGDDDGGGIGDIFSDVVGAAGDELKKFGSSASSQVTGSKGGQASNSSDDTSVLTQFKKFGQSVTSQVTGSQPSDDNSSGTKGKHSDYDYSLFGELKKFGQSATSQVSGHEPPISEGDVRAMAKSDDAFSKKESAAVAAKIKQIYAQYAAKSAHEEKQEEMVEKQKEEMKVEQKKEIKKEETNAAIQKT